MSIFFKSRSLSLGLKLGCVGLKTRSLGQILRKPCVHSRGHSFDPIFMKLNQNDSLKRSRSSFKLGHVGLKVGNYVKFKKKRKANLCTL